MHDLLTADGVTPSLFTVRELRDLFSVARSTVYRWIKAGRLRRSGYIQDPDRGQALRVALVEITDAELRRRGGDALVQARAAGRRPRFLTQRLAVVASATSPANAPGAAAGESETERQVHEFERMLQQLREESAARHELLAELEAVARLMRTDRELELQTESLAEVLESLAEVRARELALLQPEAPPPAAESKPKRKRKPRTKASATAAAAVAPAVAPQAPDTAADLPAPMPTITVDVEGWDAVPSTGDTATARTGDGAPSSPFSFFTPTGSGPDAPSTDATDSLPSHGSDDGGSVWAPSHGGPHELVTPHHRSEPIAASASEDFGRAFDSIFDGDGDTFGGFGAQPGALTVDGTEQNESVQVAPPPPVVRPQRSLHEIDEWDTIYFSTEEEAYDDDLAESIEATPDQADSPVSLMARTMEDEDVITLASSDGNGSPEQDTEPETPYATEDSETASSAEPTFNPDSFDEDFKRAFDNLFDAGDGFGSFGITRDGGSLTLDAEDEMGFGRAVAAENADDVENAEATGEEYSEEYGEDWAAQPAPRADILSHVLVGLGIVLLLLAWAQAVRMQMTKAAFNPIVLFAANLLACGAIFAGRYRARSLRRTVDDEPPAEAE